jgi:predicted site-specific integrase-resolvase
MKKAVLYARVSSGLQKKEHTIESQIAVLKVPNHQV